MRRTVKRRMIRRSHVLPKHVCSLADRTIETRSGEFVWADLDEICLRCWSDYRKVMSGCSKPALLPNHSSESLQVERSDQAQDEERKVELVKLDFSITYLICTDVCVCTRPRPVSFVHRESSSDRSSESISLALTTTQDEPRLGVDSEISDNRPLNDSPRPIGEHN